MKRIGSLFLTGFIPPVVLAIFMKFISLNMSYSIILGTVLLFLLSSFQIKNSIHFLIKAVIILGPLSLVYYLLILGELPGLWISIVIFAIAVVLGLLNTGKLAKLSSGLLVTAFSVVVALFWVPNIVADNLSQKVNDPAPKFKMLDLIEQKDLDNTSFSNKVVVIDFFGTWCAPCIAEMKELEGIRANLVSNGEQVEFIIACTDTGGDTPEKALSFHLKRATNFRLAYDENSVAHKKFGFTGVPALVILDKKGNVRMKHEGYNQAEDLEGSLKPLLEELLIE
ncbi:hypothetical protein MATR_05180 [Marivirga tractuosa]|uniref:Redoxin domain protein n=1 Tax=Marivirga tractuosa (strain ATCC 23168 / DSM 4126 / NBRC 15989 / NCIMB 1408 / VKM B-1430 / H-43) TaxID=643867 RepID=E4TSN9_MARTH|nr:TlpA disulfide reductase family protein [Marivirga tractuosa]ADR21849.1 Redoxin domain protein [Marivirga tractuosa DSM 4126]BDD13693.1 hypothetical protein MATR_05180 [Marivirga tractuosa]